MSLAYLSFQRPFLSCLYRNTNCTSGKKDPRTQCPKTKRRAILKESIFNIILFCLFLFRGGFENISSQWYLAKALSHSCYLSICTFFFIQKLMSEYGGMEKFTYQSSIQSIISLYSQTLMASIKLQNSSMEVR